MVYVVAATAIMVYVTATAGLLAGLVAFVVLVAVFWLGRQAGIAESR